MDEYRHCAVLFRHQYAVPYRHSAIFGLVANAVWPIYYAMASDSAEERATSTANGIITTAMFIGGGISPLLMGWLIQFGGGWENPAGYIYAFFTMAGCALLGMLLQLMTTDKTPRKAH